MKLKIKNELELELNLGRKQLAAIAVAIVWALCLVFGSTKVSEAFSSLADILPHLKSISRSAPSADHLRPRP